MTAADVPVRPVPDPSAAQDGRRVERQALLLSLTTIGVSGANYVFSLLVIYLMAPADYVRYAAVQSLLLVLGSGCMAAIPWAVARHVAVERSQRAAREAMGFGLLGATAQGLAFAAVTYAVVTPAGGARLGAVSAVAAFALSVVAAPLGVLQGQQRVTEIAALRVLEAVVRLGLSVLLLVSVSATPVSPVIGFTVGSLVLFTVALLRCGHARRPRVLSAAVWRPLLRRSVLLGVAQACLAALGVVDTVVVVYTALSDEGAAAYQLAALLGRVPLFLGTAVALTYFQGLARADDDRARAEGARAAFGALARMALPVALLVVTCPPLLLDLLTDGRAEQVGRLLPATVVLGLAVAVTTVLLMPLQAQDRFRAVLRLLVPVTVLQPVVLLLAGTTGSAGSFAVAAAAVGAVSTVAAVVVARRLRPWAGVSGTDLRRLAVLAVLCVVGLLHVAGWAAAVVYAVVTLVRGGSPGAVDGASDVAAGR